MKHYHIGIMALAVCLLMGCSENGEKRLSDKQLVEAFKNPDNEWRGKPFWAWNGKLEKEELLRQVDVMREMGFGGYFMHSRVGLQTEYLGEEWFELTNAVADYGQQQGMINYLYDEDRWPSGTAGGYVTKDPKYRMNFVVLRIVPLADFEWADSLMAAFACQLEGTSFTNLQRLQPKEKPTSGNSVLAFFRQRAADTDFVNGFSYVDAMNAEATKRFIQLTHDAYDKKCEGRVGNSIKGIFTDEPHRGPLFTKFSNDNPDRPYMCPWTDSLPDAFRERFGEDIVEQLPYLFLHPDGQVYHKVKWQYVELAQELFLNNFMRPLYDWCTAHNIDFTGHLLHEDNFVSQVAMQGSLMRSYELMHIPGVDVLTQDNRKYWIVKQLASVGRQLGKKRLLSELYGATGWQMTFEDYKQVGDWQALYGINLRCPHLSWYTMEGEAKRDYPASMFFQSGWYKDFKYVEDYYARLGMLLAQGRPQCDVLVISPIESVFAQVAVDAFNDLLPKSTLIAEIEQRYFDLFYWLQTRKIDFDYGDEEMMSRLAKIEVNQAGEPVLRVGKAEYKTVFIGNMSTMRYSTFQLLKEFKAKGGHIVQAGDAPTMIDVQPNDSLVSFFSTTTHVEYEKSAVTNALLSTIAPVVTVCDSLGNNIDSIFCQSRTDGDRTLYVLMNMSGKDDFGKVTVHLPTKGKVSEWNCRNGEVYARHDATEEKEGMTLTVTFAPLQEHVLMTSTSPVTEQAMPPDDKGQLVYVFPEEYDYELNEPNVLPLDMAYYSVDGRRSPHPVEVLHADRIIRQSLGLKPRSGEMLQPWFFAKYVNTDRKEYGEVKLEFPFTVAHIPEDDIYLCIETPDKFDISLNGASVGHDTDGWWIDPCYKRILLKGLKEGLNMLSLTTKFTEDLNIEVPFLTGRFGVTVKVVPTPAHNTASQVVAHEQPTECCYTDPVITRLPERLHTGNIVTQGLPFYSGTVSYKVSGLPEASEKQNRRMAFSDFEAACIHLRQGKEHQTVAFAPYQADTRLLSHDQPLFVDVVLSRRNTFGPLHFLPARNWAYYPDLFVAPADEGYTDNYVLLPMGLLDKPYIEEIKLK